MLKQNSELRAQAREALRGKWPMAAVAALIYSAIAGGLSAIPVIGGLCSLFVGLPVAYGFTIVMLGVCRGKDIDFGGRTACCIRFCYFDAGCIQRSGRS